MEHSLHVACKHFIETVAPTSPAAIRKKVNAPSTFNQENPEDGGKTNEDEDDSDTEFTAGDALGKALALVKQVSMIMKKY